MKELAMTISKIDFSFIPKLFYHNLKNAVSDLALVDI